MRALKTIALVSVIVLCLPANAGIAAAIYVNTSWLRNEIYLSCTAEANADYAGGFNWTLIVDKRANDVRWEGWGNDGKPRTTECSSASVIRVSWNNDKKQKVVLNVNSLDGSFQGEIIGDTNTPKLIGRSVGCRDVGKAIQKGGGHRSAHQVGATA